MDYKANKINRIMELQERLNKGEYISKKQLALEFNVTEKTISRDIDDIRAFFAEKHIFENEVSVEYDRSRNQYYLVKLERDWLTNEEVLAVSKILLESRALNKNELNSILLKLLMQVAPSDKKHVENMILNEKYHYIPLKHGQALLEPIWKLSNFITENEIIEINYTRKDGVCRTHKVKPVAIMFSEYYFYLITFMADDSKDFPTVFRVDRIENFKSTKEKFKIPYNDRFSDGEFRKRVQFMYSGELKTVMFEYIGQSIEAVLDRLPTAEILSEKDGVYRVKVEVYGNGIDMWLKSQGDSVRIL